MRSPCAVPQSATVWYFAQRKLGSDGDVGATADAGHGAEKSFEAGGVGVEGCEGFMVAGGFVLVFAGAQGGGEVTPVMEEALVRHLQDAADVGRLVLVEKDVARRGVGIATVLAFEKSESDEGIEEVARGAGVQAEAAGQRFQALRAFGEFGEDFHLNSAKQSFRGPEGQAGLQNVFG